MSASRELNEAQCCLSRAAMILKELGLTSLAVQLRRTENLLRQISNLVTEENIKAVAEEQIDAKEQA